MKCSQQITNRSQQIQISRSKFTSLTANSNRSQRITNYTQQIQIAHSKLKSLTANSRVCIFVGGRGYFFEFQGYIVEGPYVTLKMYGSQYREFTLNLSILCSPLVSLFLSVYSVVTQRSSAVGLRWDLWSADANGGCGRRTADGGQLLNKKDKKRPKFQLL